VRPRAGDFRVRDGVPIVLDPGSDERDWTTARSLADAAARLGLHLPIESHARVRDLGARIHLSREGADVSREGADGQGYRLEVGPECIEISGAGPAGLRYGVETLKQLLARRVPGCRIEDEPSLAMRGLMLDVSRGKVPTTRTLHELVDLCVALKLNVLMLYTEHTFRFRRHPEIGADASSLEAETLRGLDAYAALHHVELVPCLQSLGHMQHVLGIPRYRHLDESDRGWTLSPAQPGTYELLADLYDEYLPNFRSRWFNANCDEPWDLGTGRSKTRADRIGRTGVYLEHVHRVRDLAARHGKRTMIWGDVVHEAPERIAEIDRDLVLLDWWYESRFDYDRVRVFGEHGLDFLVCPGTASWNTLFPRLETSQENITRWAEAGRRHGALGLLCTDWGDGGHYNLLGNSWFGYAFAAQQAWSGDVPPRDFDRAFGRVLFSEGSGAAARAYRSLGALHETGFQVFNASPLQLLFFDDLDRAYFVQGCRPAVLRRTLRRLEAVTERLEGAADAFGAHTQTRDELVYAGKASQHAARKGLAGGTYLAWRKRPGSLDARARRRLAGELRSLARQQRVLGRRLRQLWLARSRPSNFEITKQRLDVAVTSLRRAARALDRNRPPPPPDPPSDFFPGSVVSALRATAALPKR
jgi:hypothetical protein